MAPRRQRPGHQTRIRRKIKDRARRLKRSKRLHRHNVNRHHVDIEQANTIRLNLRTEINRNTPSVHKELDNNKLMQSCSTLEGSNPITAAQLQKELPFVMNKDTMHLKIKDTGSQIENIPIKIEPFDREKRVELGGGVKRKRIVTNTEKVDANVSSEDLSSNVKSTNNDHEQKCLISCSEITKLLIANLPNQFSEADVFHLFGRYQSVRSAYFVSTNNAVIVLNDEIEVSKVIKDYDGLLLHGSEQPLKINIMNVMRRYEYGSPLKLVHYQVVKHPSMFAKACKYPAIKSEPL